ncbi:zinc ABC transporter substrate-binding protein [Limibaculum sp. FT325]|uniref:zinc ABC transporter substrate-binding protein n=1 Tax=Thermohalobaculum sediminis TaxID=2939436 RepID=UPI0020C07F38|nr:zinc ABC transporter substrate-binding protein [Limibaculum sediminis]MCL5779062.1 zinc ABC transporter substrate-binding protein [Limibaculum sediminis]
MATLMPGRAAFGGMLPAAIALVAALGAGPAAAQGAAAPRVATDIAPVHSLVARVMQGIGAPDLVVPPGASPHGYAMRPSEAGALDDAVVVFWVGPGLAPWFGEAAAALASDATVLALADVPGAVRLPVRTGGRFEGHEHAHGDESHDSAGSAERHADAADHAHDEETDGDDHAHDHADGRDEPGHAEAGAVDEHMWLDPANARLWLGAIAETLAGADPANAAAYRANAAAGQAELDALMSEIGARLAPLRDRRFIVFHDAYQYFEARFGIPAAGAIALSDAARPSAARVAEIREVVAQLGAVCVFSEPQFEPRVVATVIEGTGARRGTLDPLGAELEIGPGLYPALIGNLVAALEDCLAAGD